MLVWFGRCNGPFWPQLYSAQVSRTIRSSLAGLLALGLVALKVGKRITILVLSGFWKWRDYTRRACAIANLKGTKIITQLSEKHGNFVIVTIVVQP